MLRRYKFFISITQFLFFFNFTKQQKFKQTISALKTISNTITNPFIKTISKTFKSQIIKKISTNLKNPMSIFIRKQNSIKNLNFGLEKKYITFSRIRSNSGTKQLGKDYILKYKAPWLLRESKQLVKTNNKRNVLRKKPFGKKRPIPPEQCPDDELLAICKRISNGKLPQRQAANSLFVMRGLEWLTKYNLLHPDPDVDPPEWYDFTFEQKMKHAYEYQERLPLLTGGLLIPEYVKKIIRVRFQEVLTLYTKKYKDKPFKESMEQKIATVVTFVQAAQANSIYFQNVRLLAVSTKQSIKSIKEAYTIGQRHFGENYATELAEKSYILPNDIKWHFVGHLGCNQVSEVIVPNLFCIETVDSIIQARKINENCQKKDMDLNVMVQLKTSEKLEKNGVSEDKAMKITECILNECDRLKFTGFMTSGDYGDQSSFKKNRMAKVRAIKKFGLNEKEVELSMGMTKDYVEAVLEGSNNIRVGTKLFGERALNDEKL